MVKKMSLRNRFQKFFLRLKIKYGIEFIEYTNCCIHLRGWIWEGSKSNENQVKLLSLQIVSSEGLVDCCELRWYERNDVKEFFGLNYGDVGFELNCHIGSLTDARIFLRFVVNHKNDSIEIYRINMRNSKQLQQKPSIEYPAIDGFYNVCNLECALREKYIFHGANVDKCVDVVVPVVNGSDHLVTMISSVFKTRLPIRLILVNDVSSDTRIHSYLQELCNQKKNVILLENETGLGFSKCVNRALETTIHDVALLSTDVELPEGWLERLMLPIWLNENVASSTPYTNYGNLCEFPYVGQDNKVFAESSLKYVDDILQKMKPQYTKLPTGTRLCMGMGKKAIQEVGVFKEKSFYYGYQEENDWCQRAIELGFINVQVENLYVYHKYNTFTAEEKQQLIRKNIGKLKKEYSLYISEINNYFTFDDSKHYRMYGYFMCLMLLDVPTCVCFDGDNGEMANCYLKKRKELRDSKYKYIEFRYDSVRHNYQMVLQYKEYELKLWGSQWNDLFRKFQLTRIDFICVNRLSTYENFSDILEQIVNLGVEHNSRLYMFIYDYYCVSPTNNLMDNNCSHVNIKQQKQQSIDINKWHVKWLNFMEECDNVFVFSDDSKQILEQAYGWIPNLKVVSYLPIQMLEICKPAKQSNNMNIGIIGKINESNGLSTIKQMLYLVNQKSMAVNFIIIGECEEDIQENHFRIVPLDTREQLPSIMYLYDIDVIFFATDCPKAIPSVLEDVMKLHMPLVVYDLGLPMKKVREYDKILLLKNDDTEKTLNEIVKFSNQNKRHLSANIMGKKVLFVIEYDTFSTRYRVDHLREHLATKGIHTEKAAFNSKSVEEITYILKKFDVLSIYRCAQVEKVQCLVQAAHDNGIKVIYDIDDYIFEYDRIEAQDFLREEKYHDFKVYSQQIKQCMNMCDMLTTSTETLANGIRESFPEKPVVVCRNAASLEMQLLSEIALQRVEVAKEEVVLGYFSGSKTHNMDWKLIEKEIIQILEVNKNVRLMLGGDLDISRQLQKYERRIIRFPFEDWRNLPNRIRYVDINLMPLQNNYFQWCKSENKWMEAGLVEIPTIASRNPELAQILSDGVDVIFCDSPQAWVAKLQHMVNDRLFREQIGKNAKKEVYRSHLVTSENNFDKIVKVILEE